MTQNEAWEKILGRLRSFVKEQIYESCMKPLKVQVAGERMVLLCPNIASTQILKTRYASIIQAVVQEVYGRAMEVTIVSEGASVQEAPEIPMVAGLKSAPLNPRYTFDKFVVGESNRFAHAASLAVAELPSEAYNPLFLYGGVGLGKTHLMNAIGHYILEDNPACNLLYITSETFTNEVIDAIQNKKNQQLREKLRSVDVLMIDDIQFIAGKTSTQEEFFHTFNHLHTSGKQIVLSSDRPPKDIPTLEERLRSRFEWGLIVDIQKPDYETRVAILRKKAASEYLDVPDEVLHLIAEKVESNIRELEGVLTRVAAQSDVNGVPITLDSAKSALSTLVGIKDPKRITPEVILRVVAEYYRVATVDLLSQRRNREISLPRQVAMYLTREMTGLSTTRIGDAFGGRDHTTVMHGCDKIADLVKNTPQMAQTVQTLKEEVGKQ